MKEKFRKESKIILMFLWRKGGFLNQTYIKTSDNVYLFCREPWNYRGWGDINAIANGCGPQGWKEKIVPDSILGCKVKEACAIHDVDYEEGSTIEEKDSADRTLLNNLLRLIDGRTTTWLAKKMLLMPRKKLAYVYYVAVCKFGGPAYWDKHLKK